MAGAGRDRLNAIERRRGLPSEEMLALAEKTWVFGDSRGAEAGERGDASCWLWEHRGEDS